MRRIEAAARSVWPGCRAALFGSQATGLALPGADLDVVVLGASTELQRAGSGFTKVRPLDVVRVLRVTSGPRCHDAPRRGKLQQS